MVDKSLSGEDPIKSVTLLHAVRWSIQAWNEVQSSTIANCWRRSTLLGKAHGPEKPPANWDHEKTQLQNSIQQLQDGKVIANQPLSPEALTEFIDPPDEQLQDVELTSDELIHYCANLYAPEEPEDMEEELEQPIEISVQEAMEALQKVRLYEEQQEDSNQEAIELYNKMERLLLRRKLESNSRSSKQISLDGFLKPQKTVQGSEAPSTTVPNEQG